MKATYDTHQAAESCDCSVRWVQKMARQHGLGTKVRGRIAFTRDEVAEMKRTKKSNRRGNPNWNKEN